MPMQKSLYPKDWNSTARAIKAAAGWRCQRCKKRHGDPTFNRFGRPCRVVLTVAHLDHDPRNPNARLAVLCSRCHLSYDAGRGQRRRKEARMSVARGQLTLFDEMKEEGTMSP